MRNQDEFNLFKEYFKSRLNLEMWKFETLGRTKYFSTENTLKVLDNEIYRMSNILDSGWPFTSYHFDSSVFDEDNFFEGEYIHNFLCDYQKFIAECNESSEIMTSIETTYTRAKWLEFLIQEKNRLLQPKSTETNHSVEVNKDTRFWLTRFENKEVQNSGNYKSFQRNINDHGYIAFNVGSGSVKVYTPELCVIFTSSELEGRNMDTKTETKINGREYLDTYVDSYKEGELFFESEHKISTDTLYGTNAKKYVTDIRSNFFHINHIGTHQGWSYVKYNYPFILSHKVIRDFGYYSGIVSKVEEQINRYPELFADFDKCEQALPDQQSEKSGSIKFIAKEYALAYIFDLYSEGKQIPVNRTDGGLNAKQIKEDSALFSSYDKTADGFYRAVRTVSKYDLNKSTDLQNISKDWLNAVRRLSNNWVVTEQCLKEKGLIGD